MVKALGLQLVHRPLDQPLGPQELPLGVVPEGVTADVGHREGGNGDRAGAAWAKRAADQWLGSWSSTS